MDERKTLLFPVRRKLMLVTVSYLAGVLSASACPLPIGIAIASSALVMLSALLCRRYRRSVLFCIAALMLLLGNGLAGMQLGMRDAPAPPRSQISGTIAAIESDFRVYLTDVRVEGEPSPRRDVLVTLMLEDEEVRETVFVGQRVSGTGRLFAQDEQRNPGGVNRRVQAICEGYELSGYILPGWTAQGESRFSLREWIRQLRLALIVRIKAQFGEQAALFEGIMIGEKGDVDGETLASMRLTGTVHVLTVSGLHLGMIASALRAMLKRLPIGKKLRFAVQAFVLVFFACLTGGAPGTIRACIMALIREMAGLTGRRYEPLTALSAAALAITLVCPIMALNASFQFSFFVVLGILMLAGQMTRAVQSLLGGLRLHRLIASLALSLVAQLSAIPMQLLLYGYIPLLALPMNVVFSFCMPVLMLGGWAVLAVGFIWPGLGMCMSGVLSGAMKGLETLSLFAADVEGGLVRLPAPYAASVLLVPVLMALLSDRIRIGGLRRRLTLLVSAALVLSYVPRFDPRPMYVQLDVGQGDAALFRKNRRAVLVDVGPADSYDMLRYLRSEGLEAELVVLSHLDVDHAGALLTLLNSEVSVGSIVVAEGALDGDVEESVIEAFALARQMGVPIEAVEAGDEVASSTVRLSVISPDDALSGGNERSLVLVSEFGGRTFLTTGDLPEESEPEILPDCDVLKVAHHGSKYATTMVFLEKTTPETAIISVGADNTYGHPTQRVLDDLSRIGARVYRTDQSGCVTVYPSEESIEVKTYLNAP